MKLMSEKTVTNSERKTTMCQHLHFLKYGLALSAPYSPRTQEVLFQGTVFHEAMELYHSTNEDPLKAAQDHTEAIRMEAQEEMDFNTPEEEVVVDITNAVDDMLQRYHQKWSHWDWRQVLSEERLSAWVRSPTTGKRSTRTRFAGKLDLLVEMEGEYWLVEHKTTSIQLDKWVQTKTYDAQAPTYAWLVKENLGVEVKGIIYDLVHTKPPKPASSFKTTQKGDRLRKTNGVPFTTAAIFRQALHNHGFTEFDQEWYGEALDAMEEREREGFWFKRHVHVFTKAELYRASQELYQVGTYCRRVSDQTSQMRAVLRETSEEEKPSMVSEMVQRFGYEYPRNPSVCHMYGRPCEFMELCKSQSVDAAAELRVRNSRHSELD